MKRKQTDAVKAEVARLLERITEMERMAGWTRYSAHGVYASSNPHPDDSFNGGQYVAAVKRASLDLSRLLIDLRKS